MFLFTVRIISAKFHFWLKGVFKNKHNTVAFTQGQGQMFKVKGKKSNILFSRKKHVTFFTFALLFLI